VKQVYEIAKIKQGDAHMKRLDLLTIARMIVASAGSMGIKITADRN
jgi:ribosomal protein L11